MFSCNILLVSRSIDRFETTMTRMPQISSLCVGWGKCFSLGSLQWWGRQVPSSGHSFAEVRSREGCAQPHGRLLPAQLAEGLWPEQGPSACGGPAVCRQGMAFGCLNVAFHNEEEDGFW